MTVNRKTRRTTLTLPVSIRSNVAANEALEDGLRQKLALERAEDFVHRLNRAFAGLTDEELLLVNGIHVGRHPTNKSRADAGE